MQWSCCLRDRTALINQLRGLLSEYGEVAPLTRQGLRHRIPDVLEDADNGLTFVMRRMVQRMLNQWLTLDEDIEALEQELQGLVTQHPNSKRLQTIPGVGPIGTALILASVNDAKAFKNGRQFAAWVGLTPKQYASGDHARMGAITKRGNGHLRKTLIHGARTVLNWCERKDDPLSVWCQNLKKNLPPCKAIVALANKLARIIWAVLAHNTTYQPMLAAGKQSANAT